MNEPARTPKQLLGAQVREWMTRLRWRYVNEELTREEFLDEIRFVRDAWRSSVAIYYSLPPYDKSPTK